MSLLPHALSILEQRIAPLATGMDTESAKLSQALDILCEEGLICLRRAAVFGGPATAETDFREFQEAVAATSGTLAFLQTQHQSGVSLIAKGDRTARSEELLRNAHRRDSLIGIGFSQLRRPGAPILRAEPTDEGFSVTGHLPWATGFGFFVHLLVGAALPDGRSLFFIMPFADGPGVRFSEPMDLAVMGPARTVTAEFEGYRVSASDALFTKEPDWIHANDMLNVSLQGSFALGCAKAGIRLVRKAFEKKGISAVGDAAASLEQEWEACKASQYADVPLEDRVRWRAWAIDLSVRCAHAAVVSQGGSANSTSSDAQRVYREALVFSVSAQTTPILEATLQRLIR